MTERNSPADFMIGDYMPLKRGGWWIRRFDLNYEARTLELWAEYIDLQFQLKFTNFHLVYWSGCDFMDYDPGVRSADVIGIAFDETEPRKKTVITTDLFEISLNYDDLTIEKAW